MLRICTLALLVLAQLGALAATPALAADATISTDRRLPKDVLAYVSIRNFAEFRKQMGDTSWGRLVRDEAVADFRRELEAKIAELSKQIEELAGMGLGDLAEIPQGEVAVAVMQPANDELAVVLLLDFGDKEPAVRKLIEKGVAGLEQRGAKSSTEDYEDIQLNIYRTPPDEDDEKDDDKLAKKSESTTVYFLKDSVLVMGGNLAAIKSVALRWDGKHQQTLADNETYRQVLETCRDENQPAPPLVVWYVDPIGFFKAAISAGRANTNPIVAAYLPVIGLDKLRCVGGAFDRAGDEFDTISRMLISIDQPAAGLLDLLDFPAVALAPPRWVPAQAASYFSFNWNIEKSWGAVESLVDTLQGQRGLFASLVDQLSKNPEAGGLHVKKDVIDHLSGVVHIVGDFSDPDDVRTQRLLIAAGLKNGGAMRAALAKFAALPFFKGKSRTFQGETIYDLPVAAKADDDKPPRPAAGMGLAIAENHLMFASDVTLLEQVLRGGKDQDSLAESPGYRKIAAKFPAQTSSIGFQKQDAQVRTLYELLRSGAAPNPFGDEVKLDFSKLPAFDAIRKYMTPSGSYMRPTPHGLLIVSFSLRQDTEQP